MPVWNRCKDRLPSEDFKVMTKIDDEKGVRNEQVLIIYNRMLWFPDMSMYIYYSPTHWRSL